MTRSEAGTAASGTTDLIKKIVTVVDPQNSADVVFAATQADVYVLSGTSLVSIGGPLPKTGTGIQIQDIAGASNSQKYVVYATVTRKPDTSQTSGWSIPVWRYAKVGTSTPAWVSDSSGLNLGVQTDTRCHSGWGAFEAEYHYLAPTDTNPDIA